MGLTSVGAVVALVGIFLDHRLLVWVAIAILVAAFAIRLIPHGGSGPADPASGPDDPA